MEMYKISGRKGNLNNSKITKSGKRLFKDATYTKLIYGR